jgi:rRNA-processing protein FCF1
MVTVAMDTNALMMPVELDVRVFDELDRLFGTSDLVTPRAVLDELEKLAAGSNGEEGVAASVGSDLATRHCRVVETDASYADDAIVELADRGECDYVVTNDRPLRDRLLEHGVRVVGIRGRNTLAVTEP